MGIVWGSRKKGIFNVGSWGAYSRVEAGVFFPIFPATRVIEVCRN